MGTFTIIQTQAGKDAYFFPSVDGCKTDLTPVGETNNFECVDDPRLGPDIDTYVYGNTPSVVSDLYEIPNHTTETGTINYIQVYARAKADLIPQDPDGLYKIIITDNACSNIYKSDDIDLLTGYRTYNKIWTTNPRTAAAWTWSDFDNLQVGVECSSPIVSEIDMTLTLRPTGDNDIELTQLLPPPNNNYEHVDDTVPDWNDTAVYWDDDANKKRDLYDCTDHTTETGVINKVIIFNYNRSIGLGISYHYVYLKTHGTEYFTEYLHPSPGTQWTLYSDEYINNPFTGVAWTWAEIDDLLIGTGVKFNSQYGMSTQVYAIVYYTAVMSPQIHTTQCYAKVNYSEESECSLQKPEKISVDHVQNIKMLNFWSGNRAVYGTSRGNRTMVMTGAEYGNGACETIQCVRDMGEAGDKITLSGLNSDEFNKDFRILSFGYVKVSEKPLHFKWILELEYED